MITIHTHPTYTASTQRDHHTTQQCHETQSRHPRHRHERRRRRDMGGETRVGTRQGHTRTRQVMTSS